MRCFQVAERIIQGHKPAQSEINMKRHFHFASYLTGLKEQLPLVHDDLVCVGQGCPEGEDMLILEHLQRPGFPTLIHRDGVCADTQPKLLWEAAFLALMKTRGSQNELDKQLEMWGPGHSLLLGPNSAQRAECTWESWALV